MFERRLDEALNLLESLASRFNAVRSDLNALVDYVVVGGAAVTQYGWSRLTQDIDVLMDRKDYDTLNVDVFEKRPSENKAFGLLHHKPTGMKIDVLFGGEGKFPSITSIGRSENDRHLVSVEDLIYLKTLRGDPSDYGDIYRIVKSGTVIDWEVVRNKVSPKAWGRIEDDMKHLI